MELQEKGNETITLNIEGMVGLERAESIEKKLRSLAGVASIDVSAGFERFRGLIRSIKDLCPGHHSFCV